MRMETFISGIKEGRGHTTVYVIEAGDFVKIGVAGNLDTRLKSLQTGNPLTLKPLRAIITTDTCFDNLLEKSLHRRYREVSAPAGNEWFYKNGIEELLRADAEYVRGIAYREGLNGNHILRVEGFSTEVATALRDYLDWRTLHALADNYIFSFDDLERFFKSGRLGKGIGDVRYNRIKEAYKIYMEEKK